LDNKVTDIIDARCNYKKKETRIGVNVEKASSVTVVSCHTLYNCPKFSAS